ncbi:MAG: hypothetical protein GY719_42025 [bacterium]|nr:hypothetical protein [bacterium]
MDSHAQRPQSTTRNDNRRGRKTSVLLLAFLLAACLGLPATASTPATDEPSDSLWLAGLAGVAAIEPGTGRRIAELADTEAARALAVDVERRAIWVATDAALSRFALDGTLQWRVELEAGETGRETLVVAPGDGSAWLARGESLHAFGPGGQELQRLELDAPARGLALDADSSLLWVATEGGLRAHDAIGGQHLRSLELAAALRSFALDEVGGTWALAGGRLERFDADGLNVAERGHQVPADTVGLIDGHGDDLWLLGRATVDRLDSGGAVARSLLPFGEQGEILAWAIDPATRALWLSDGRELVRVSASGWELERLSLGDGAEALDLRDLAAFSPVPDIEAPELDLLSPRAWATVKTARPGFEVRYADDRSGVRAGSLAVTVDGKPAEARCDYRPGGATCELITSPKDGDVELAMTVADEMGNVSLPAVAFLEVRATADGGGQGDEASDGDDDQMRIDTGGGPPVYTPVVSPRGFRPNVPFLSASDVDHVDTASGNLVVTIPLGQTYEVGSTLKYQVRPVYNSNIWQFIEFGCPIGGCPSPLEPITFASTNYASNAGLGWELHFGRLYGPVTPQSLSSNDRQRWPNQPRDLVDMNDRWMYVAPTGEVTYLHSMGGRNNGTSSNPVRYSKDGKHVRMRRINSSEIQVHMPDGLISVFKSTNQLAGTEFCRGGTLKCWRFHEMRDAYGNYMRVSYSLSGITETWTVSDSSGRQHKVVFSHSHADTAGGDAPPDFGTQDGDEIGDLRKVVKRVELAAFGSQKATYNFYYATKSLPRGAPHEANELPAAANTLRTRVLSQISVPHSQPWKFTTYTASDPDFSGRLTEVTAPARGKIAWEYTSTEWFVPTRCSYHTVDAGSIDWDYAATGVRRRISKKPNGSVEGIWTYESDLYPSRSSLDLSGPNCSRANYRKTVVNAATDSGGKHTRTVFYNSVAQGPRYPSSGTSIDQWQVTDGGLPLVKDYRIGSSTSTRRYLSRRIYHCSGGSCGGAKRSVYVRYASEWRGAQCNKNLGDSPGCYQANPMLVAERTIFHDDGGKYIDVEHQQYNGAGSFRRTLTKDNFSGSVKTRTDTTNYTATGSTTLGINGTTGYVSRGTPSSYLPAPTARWILHPYSKKTAVEGGRTYVTEFQFNSQGSMNCWRKWKSPSGRGSKDLVTTLGFGTTAGADKGLPVTETAAGGEWANLSTSMCSTSGSASNGSRYVINHRYQYLQLKRTYISGYPNWYRATIDRNTGLPSVTYNAADQSTSHAFDLLGRLTAINPTASLGKARTAIVYRNPSTGEANVETSRYSTSGSLLIRETQVYDHFARPNRNIQRRPSGNASYNDTEQKTYYNALGWVARVTTRQNKSAVNTNLATWYSNYDAFGRPGRVMTPDNWAEDRTYAGDRVSTSKRSVRTSLSGNTNVTTTTLKDSRGRVTRVSNPIYTTNFTYDPYDQQVSAKRTGSGINQTRLYGYDARGLLLNERHPEVGVSGNGYVTYRPDAFGNRRRLEDHGRNLTYVYDNAGRLTQIKNTSGGKLWREWLWANANSGADYRKGKVIREVRHNYPGGGSDDWAIHEEYEYRGKLGKVSKKTTQLQFPHLSGNDRYDVFFSQTFAYDQLGNPTSYGYPACQTTPQNGRRQCNDGSGDVQAPSHTVSVTYNQGRTRRVSSNLGIWADHSYHHNLQTSRIDYSNGVDGIFDQGTNGMVKPRRLRYVKGSATRYDSGTIYYDGTGNIWQIGADRYYYDKASRLLYGTVAQAGSGYREEYTYDAADNMKSYRRNGWSWISQQVSSSTNRMTSGISYDGAGNMTSVGSPALYVMQYDELNQQVQFDNNTSGQQSIHLYAFGPGEKRLITYDAYTGERTFKLRDLQGRVLREYKVNGWGDYGGSSSPGAAWVFEKDYVHGPGGLIATRSRNGTRYFFHPDHLGSPRAITDSAGVRRGWRHFYPFGAAVSTSSGVDESTVKFTGHERDPNNLTDYKLARTYLFPFGRFASVDPARDGWNLYTYVGNNPIGFVDPTGLASCPAGGSCQVSTVGPNGGRRSQDDIERLQEQRKDRNARRDARSRRESGQTLSGQGRNRPDKDQAAKGSSGDRPTRQGGRNRERNIGIEEEDTRVAKGKGGRGARGAVGARANTALIILDAISGALALDAAEGELGREMTMTESLRFMVTGERPQTFEECAAAGNCT